VNDVLLQQLLFDRRLTLRILDCLHVPTPSRIEVNRDGGPNILDENLKAHLRAVTGLQLETSVTTSNTVQLLDDGDTLCVDGLLLKKPFVEKPIHRGDHNIWIYFPKNQGGGVRKLFRKIGNKRSEYTDGPVTPRAMEASGSSYIYEQYLPQDNGEDVHAYTVGPDYCHVEIRKSPAIDGYLRRNTHGREIRYMSSPSRGESEIAKQIANGFGQRVCGFDLIRAGGKSYVISVHGFSYVKDNDDYYDRCAKILKDEFITETRRARYRGK
jgi:inositol-hexakisphosphate/diphosphoinositol-pentakisphosphate 1-kinase